MTCIEGKYGLRNELSVSALASSRHLRVCHHLGLSARGDPRFHTLHGDDRPEMIDLTNVGQHVGWDVESRFANRRVGFAASQGWICA